MAILTSQMLWLRQWNVHDNDFYHIMIIPTISSTHDETLMKGSIPANHYSNAMVMKNDCRQIFQTTTRNSKVHEAPLSASSNANDLMMTRSNRWWHQEEFKNETLGYFDIDATTSFSSSSSSSADAVTTLRKAYRAWVGNVLQLLPIHRLQRSIHSQWVDPSNLHAATDILQQRLLQNHNNHNNNKTPPPLQIVVLGGSVTAGHGCHVHSWKMSSSSSSSSLSSDTERTRHATTVLHQQLACAWPARVQHLMNAMMWTRQFNMTRGDGQNDVVVKFTNLAMAATTSDVGALMLQYDLWPPDVVLQQQEQQGSSSSFPHVLLVAFGWNDALSNDATMGEIQSKVESLLQVAKKQQQQQQQQWLQEEEEEEWKDDKTKPTSCPTVVSLPLVILVDDVVRVPGRNVTEFDDFHHMMKRLANDYHVPLISVGDAMNDLKEEEWNMILHGSTTTNIHPGMAYHMAMSWIVTFNLFQLLFVPERCTTLDDEAIRPSDRPTPLSTMHQPRVTTPLQHSNCKNSKTPRRQSSPQRCAYVWMAHRVVSAKHAQDVAAAMEPYLTYNEGWRAAGKARYNKHGWLAELPNAAFGWRMTNLTAPVKVITILSMVSYSYIWKDSRLAMTIWNNNMNNITLQISGEHASKTSVIVPRQVVLDPPIPSGGTLALDFRLIGGSMFKITGMAFCSAT